MVVLLAGMWEQNQKMAVFSQYSVIIIKIGITSACLSNIDWRVVCGWIMNLCLWSRFCGGLFLDIKRKLPWFPSDFYEGFHLQSISAVLFIYLGCITNAITFGGLLGDATDNYQVHSAICRLTQNLTLWLKLNAIMFYWRVFEWAFKQAPSNTAKKSYLVFLSCFPEQPSRSSY